MPQPAEVSHHDDPDQKLEDQDKFALSDKIRFTGLKDKLGNFLHGAVHFQILDLQKLDKSKEESEYADTQPSQKQATAVDIHEQDRTQVRNDELGFAGKS